MSNKPALPNSIRKWVKELFTEAKTCDFTSHICQVASTSTAKAMNIEGILRNSCWKNANNF